MDHLSKEERSKNMSKIRSKNTKPELLFRSAIHKRGYRYSLHYKKLPGNPDLYFSKYRTALFIHGCFWHQHLGCKRNSTPKSNQNYWLPKLEGNIRRFEQTRKTLEEKKVKVFVLWECETTAIDTAVERFIQYMTDKPAAPFYTKSLDTEPLYAASPKPERLLYK